MCYGTSSGTLKQLLHFGPIIAIFLILFITISGFHCLVQWWPVNTTGGLIHAIIYCTWWQNKKNISIKIIDINIKFFNSRPILIFYNYFNSMFIGPGFVPKKWQPVSLSKFCQNERKNRSIYCIWNYCIWSIL